MPCMKCTKNGKEMWKYGANGNCVFTSEAACRKAEQAIHANENKQVDKPQDKEKARY